MTLKFPDPRGLLPCLTVLVEWPLAQVRDTLVFVTNSVCDLFS